MKPKIGLIGLVHEEAERDFWGTMQHVASIGYQGIESPSHLLEGDAAENLRRFHALGLQVTAMGVSKEDLCQRMEQTFAKAKAIATQNLIVYWGPCESKQQLLADAVIYRYI